MSKLQPLLSEPLKLVMFDLDGTLVDSVPDLHASVNHMLTQLKRPAADLAAVSHWVGNGAAVLVKRALANDFDYLDKYAEDDFGQALNLFFDHYGEHNGHAATLYPGAINLIESLKNQGIKAAVVTNKPERFSHNLLDHLSLEFDFVVGGDSLATRKPEPEMLLHCAAHLGISLSQTVMVGDSINDVRAANNAGVPIACVTYGYNHGLDIRDAMPDLVVDSLSELI